MSHGVLNQQNPIDKKTPDYTNSVTGGKLPLPAARDGELQELGRTNAAICVAEGIAPYTYDIHCVEAKIY
jgi:hypothetical protein